jgi:hypothetical protein
MLAAEKERAKKERSCNPNFRTLKVQEELFCKKAYTTTTSHVIQIAAHILKGAHNFKMSFNYLVIH